jgi:hypothetical protein
MAPATTRAQPLEIPKIERRLLACHHGHLDVQRKAALNIHAQVREISGGEMYEICRVSKCQVAGHPAWQVH